VSAPEDELRQAVALTERAAAERSMAQRVSAFFLFVQGLSGIPSEAARPGDLRDARGCIPWSLGPVPRLVLAMALHRSGHVAEARKTLAAAVTAHDWRATEARDQDGWICHALRREAEGLILTDLPAFLKGTYQPRDNDERLALLGACQFKNRTRTSARLYADAFAAAPPLADDVWAGHRYNAARAATLAGCGRGEDATGLGEAEGKRWRDQARQWLRADVSAWGKAWDSAPAARARVWLMLTQWRSDPDLAGLRDLGALEKLSAEEREEWFAVWKEVDVLLKRTTSP